jgi:hypothetical protein
MEITTGGVINIITKGEKAVKSRNCSLCGQLRHLQGRCYAKKADDLSFCPVIILPLDETTVTEEDYLNQFI